MRRALASGVLFLFSCGSPESTIVPRHDVAPIQAKLIGKDWNLEVDLDLTRPTGNLLLQSQRYDLEHAALQIETSSSNPPGNVRTLYRLRFDVDECLHARPIDGAAWPGLCGYFRGASRPVRYKPYELLIDRMSYVSGRTQLDTFEAACVPTSGAGPSCSLHGSISILSDGMRTINGGIEVRDL